MKSASAVLICAFYLKSFSCESPLLYGARLNCFMYFFSFTFNHVYWRLSVLNHTNYIYRQQARKWHLFYIVIFFPLAFCNSTGKIDFMLIYFSHTIVINIFVLSCVDFLFSFILCNIQDCGFLHY